MKKLLLTTMLICFVTYAFSQTRIMTIATALSKMGNTKIQMTDFVKNKGFKLISSSDGCFSYELLSKGVKRTILVCYIKDKVNALAWTEHKDFIDVALPEVQRERYMLMNENPYYHFLNLTGEQQLNIMRRNNDIFISIGPMK